MELVYLWVEKYKNIKNQGFNFSPRFDCKYDKDSNELTIDEKKDYISVFPDNINITAIVGENGSGKSNLLDFIMDLDGWTSTDCNYFYIIRKEFKLVAHTINMQIKSCIDNEHRIRSSIDSSSVSKVLDINFVYLNISPFINSLNIYSNLLNSITIYNYEDSTIFEHFNNQEFFKSIIFDIPNLLQNDFIYDFFEIKGKPKYFVFKLNKQLQKQFPKESEELFNNSIKKYDNKNTITYQLKIDSNTNLNYLKEVYNKFQEYKQTLTNEIHDINIKFNNPIMDNEFVKMKNDNNIKKERRKQRKIKELKELGEIKFYLADEINSNNLFFFSTGELLILFYLRELNKLQKRKENLILLIDECELFLHPEWQKKFIKFITKLLTNNTYKRQIIMASHSPFILSDIPKKNVIFLKNGKQEKAFEHKQTFGANIHTLLSDGFFMEDGLMGDFAKEKIEDIISFHKNIQKEKINKEEKKDLYINTLKKKFWHIQSIIGDDYLKQVIKNHLIEIEKILLGKPKAKENEIKRLKAQIDLLEQE